MLVHMIAMHMVQVAIVQEIDVIAVRDARVVAVGFAVYMARMGVGDGVVAIGISS
jgi:hypothetical protein